MEIEQILSDPLAIKQALVYLYQRQTPQEQGGRMTVEQNGSGFNMIDAEILSSFAEQILNNWELSEKQLAVAKKCLPKYHGQLENNMWIMVQLPEPKERPDVIVHGDEFKMHPDYSGLLKAEDKLGTKGLVFFPNVYPSKGIKTIGFTHWADKGWHQASPSVNQAVIDDVKKMFGNIYIGDDVKEALNQLHPEVGLPEFVQVNEHLFDYQKETIKFQLEHPRALIALAPRLGKTVTTIFATQAADCKKILVVAPLSLLLDWKKKVKRWCDEDAVVVYKKQLPIPAKWTITNYDTLRLHSETFFDGGWDTIIVDESLLVKNRHAKRTEIVKDLLRNANPKYAWLLSGAPISRYYDDLWAQMNILDSRRFSSYWRFAGRYCQIESNQWSKYNLIGNLTDAAENIKHDLSDMYFARTQEEVLDLPPWRIEDISIPMSKSQDKMYGSMEEAFLAELDEDNTLIASNVLSQMIRLVQIASNPLLIEGKDDSPKWDAAVEMLSFEEHPAILWTTFIETAKAMVERLEAKGYRVAKLTGSTPSIERQPIVDKFQNGELDAIVAHPAVGKFGLDLYSAKTVIYIDRNYSGDDYYQSLNRVRHIDAKTSPHIIHLLSERFGEEGGQTVDHVINKILQGRRENVLKITSGKLKELFFEKES